MRLSPVEQDIIKSTIRRFDPEARVFLFGSRANDELRGGDIDLLILSENLRPVQRIDIKVELKKKLGDQKIDIIIASDLSKPFTRIAYQQATKL
jgi:predicted nucleotidyltransferase